MMSSDFSILIPARLASTRLSEKLLRPLAGKPVIHHTLDRALESQAETVIVVADDVRLLASVDAYSAQLSRAERSRVRHYQSRQHHESGTDRIAEVIQADEVDAEVVVNLQGDEPLLPGVLIDTLARRMQSSSSPMATLIEPIDDEDDIANPNIVKVIFNHAYEAIYFSRSPIPHRRDADSKSAYYRHIGLYAYQQDFLRRWSLLPVSGLENSEKLEQLRVIEAGCKIAVAIVHPPRMTGIDSAEQLALAEKIIAERSAL